jgi:tetratricopeptide (TPR) repeat protein
MLRQRWFAMAFHLERVLKAHPSEGALYFQLGRAHAGQRLWDRAVADYTRALERGYRTWRVYFLRSEAHAEAGRLKEAAADLAAARPEAGDDLQVWHRQAVALLALGDVAGYKKVCADLVARLGKSAAVDRVNDVVWICLLHLDSGIKAAPLADLAEKVVAKQPKDARFRTTLALALSRAGRDAEALEQLNKSLEGRGGEILPEEWLLLGMVHQRLKHTDEARSWLAKAGKALDELKTSAADTPDPASATPWVLSVEMDLFRREAETLLGAPPQKPPP